MGQKCALIMVGNSYEAKEIWRSKLKVHKRNELGFTRLNGMEGVDEERGNLE